MKKSVIFATVIIALTLIISTLTMCNIFASASYQIDANMSTIMDKIAEMATHHEADALSSNPYDYIKDNDNYKKIVGLGPDALTIIRAKIVHSNSNGLSEYILAIAAEEIANVDLKETGYHWSNGKEWVTEWNRLLRNIPDDVERITSSNFDDNTKNLALSKLGVAAAPYILDKIAAGNPQYAPSIANLLKNQAQIDNTDIVQWAKDNQSKYENLRMMINALKE
jgi:hypothetical protein